MKQINQYFEGGRLVTVHCFDIKCAIYCRKYGVHGFNRVVARVVIDDFRAAEKRAHELACIFDLVELNLIYPDGWEDSYLVEREEV